jgi:hypothetical protein
MESDLGSPQEQEPRISCRPFTLDSTGGDFFGCDVIHHPLQDTREEFAAIHPRWTGDPVAIS